MNLYGQKFYFRHGVAFDAFPIFGPHSISTGRLPTRCVGKDRLKGLGRAISGSDFSPVHPVNDRASASRSELHSKGFDLTKVFRDAMSRVSGTDASAKEFAAQREARGSVSGLMNFVRCGRERV
jgi:hypothetical protein